MVVAFLELERTEQSLLEHLPAKNVAAVSMCNIHKSFGKNHALRGVDLNVMPGTIHALLGENGAGKSTLMNILCGFYHQDIGFISINGKQVNITNPKMAIDYGIGMVHQHFMLVQTFTVAQNIMLGSELTKGIGVIDFKRANREITELSNEYRLTVNTKKKVLDMSVGMQQRVEILKVLYRGAEILILDEPTAVLTSQEANDLMQIMRNLASNNKTIVVITHKINEIKRVCDFCTIIRRGENVLTVHVDDYNEQQLGAMMVEREIVSVPRLKTTKSKKTILEIKDLVVKDDRGVKKINGVSLEVKAGEILGVAGVDENGQQELVEAITCLRKVESGTIKIHGKEIQNTTTKNVICSGISAIPEDRHRSGLVMKFSVAENMILKRYKEKPFSRCGRMNKILIKQFADDLIEKFDIRPPNCAEIPIKKLSGGNQQKVIIAREVSNNPDLLVAMQPTRGLDIGAIEYVHQKLWEQKKKEKAILLISLELNEIMEMSDRIAVIYNGEIIAVVEADATSEEEMGALMVGGGKK
ncbi:MAG: ABC transporter ATP-binding protein [Oscillospiraceae bacterium]|nr:ABC transporter ATP-binding protein [Oscillospiraceae bacterium]